MLKYIAYVHLLSPLWSIDDDVFISRPARPLLSSRSSRVPNFL